MNCVGKTGKELLDVCEQQWASVGWYKHDCVAGTGDGGGENEGYNGIHSLLERTRGDYVRRRCLGHLPWRVADHAMDNIHEATKAISSYLHDGPTWNRLKAISVNSVGDGGLGLFEDGSTDFMDFSSKAPPRNKDERPDTTVALLGWLIERQCCLMKVVKHDVATRELHGRQNKLARESIANLDHWVCRRIAYVLLKKALFVYYFVEGHENIALATDIDELFGKASKVLTDTMCDRETTKLLDTTADILAARGFAVDCHWVHVAIKLTPELSEARAAAESSQYQAFYNKVVMRMQSHLSLNVANIRRSTWVAAKLLSSNPASAKAAANELLWAPSTGIMRLRPDQCSAFETSLLASSTLMEQLHWVADFPHPKCIWQYGSTCADLFIFIADRFGGAPDHVLHCESVHAQWKFIELLRRKLKFKQLNAHLKLRHHRNHNNCLPPYDEVSQWMDELQEGHAKHYRRVLEGGTIDPRAVRDLPFAERFRLRPMDVALIKGADDGSDSDRDDREKDEKVALANYTRFLFQPGSLYQFTANTSTKWFYIAENKSVAYRNKPKPDHVVGRPLNVVWFEAADDDIEIKDIAQASDQILTQCSGRCSSLNVQNMSIAEISITSGYFPAGILPHHTERDVELLHEMAILRNNVEHFESRWAELDNGSGWVLICDSASGVDLEWYAFNSHTDVGDMTKMALARALQVRDNLSDAERTRIWNLSKTILVAAFQQGPGGGPIGVAKAAAKPATKGSKGAKGPSKPLKKKDDDDDKPIFFPEDDDESEKNV